MSSRTPPRKPPKPSESNSTDERVKLKVKKAVKSKKRPSQSLAWRLERLEKMKENYRIVEFMGLTLSGDAVKDSKNVLEKRNQLARLLMPKIYNPEEKHKKKYMRHMALINEAYSLVHSFLCLTSFPMSIPTQHTHTHKHTQTQTQSGTQEHRVQKKLSESDVASKLLQTFRGVRKKERS